MFTCLTVGGLGLLGCSCCSFWRHGSRNLDGSHEQEFEPKASIVHNHWLLIPELKEKHSERKHVARQFQSTHKVLSATTEKLHNFKAPRLRGERSIQGESYILYSPQVLRPAVLKHLSTGVVQLIEECIH